MSGKNIKSFMDENVLTIQKKIVILTIVKEIKYEGKIYYSFWRL